LKFSSLPEKAIWNCESIFFGCLDYFAICGDFGCQTCAVCVCFCLSCLIANQGLSFQVEKAFREGTARQNAHSIFVCLALKLLEERVHVACKEIITLEKQVLIIMLLLGTGFDKLNYILRFLLPKS